MIKGIDLKVDQGEVVTFIGRSGSGKTTLLRMINALELPTEGAVYVNSETYDNKDKNHKLKYAGSRVWFFKVIISFRIKRH